LPRVSKDAAAATRPGFTGAYGSLMLYAAILPHLLQIKKQPNFDSRAAFFNLMKI
jgi:hypothetical protein